MTDGALRADRYPYMRLVNTLGDETEDYIRLNREASRADAAYREANAELEQIRRTITRNVLGSAKTLNELMKLDIADQLENQYGDVQNRVHRLYHEKLLAEASRDEAYAKMVGTRTALQYITAEVRRDASVLEVDAALAETNNLEVQADLHRPQTISIAEIRKQSEPEEPDLDPGNADGGEVPALVPASPFDDDDLPF